MKKSQRKKLVDKLDKVFSLYIRARDQRCVVCGTQQGIQCGHLFSRVNHSTRWDEKNCWGQCASCNFSHEYEPYPFTRWFIDKFGLEEYDKLYKKHKETRKFTNYELETLISDYQVKYSNLVNGRSLPF